MVSARELKSVFALADPRPAPQEYDAPHPLPPHFRLPSHARALERLEKSRRLTSQRQTD
jgi:hypothetical protein